MAEPGNRGRDASSTRSGSDIVTFGEFTAHLRSAELFRSGVPVKLQLQPFRVLSVLLRRPGELVTREELRREIWGEHTAVDFEHGLNFCIKQVRAALGDDAEHPSFVATLPRRGYRFIAPVESAPRGAATASQPSDAATGGSFTARGAERAAQPFAAEADGGSADTAPDRAREGAGKRPAPAARVAWLAFLVVLIASFTLAFFALRARSVADPNAPAVLFVVPFENMTGDSAADVWCDGLTEEVIAQLASADPRHFQVIARTTSMAYRAAHEPLREIARRVQATYALEGAVRKVGDRMRVTAQLYRLKEEIPVWAKAFETTGTDLISVQQSLAAHLAASLALDIGPASSRPAPSPEAQEALAKARYLRNKNDPSAVSSSIAAFEEALRLDPENATAWSELAMAYEASAGILPSRHAIDRSCRAAKRASELSGKEALADTALGLCALHRDWDWSAAETAFTTALAKNPGLAAAHHCYAAYLSAAGRHREAVQVIERAKSLDPLSPAIVADAGWHAYLARDYPKAIREFERTLELETKDTWSREHLMMARLLAGDAAGAAREAAALAAMVSLPDEEKAALGALSPADAVPRTLQVVARRLAARVEPEGAPNPGFMAARYAGAGDREEALKWIERAATERAPWFLPVLRDPRFDSLRLDPRFAAIAERAHLPPPEHGR